ncbi:MAG: ribosome biogenesis GTP-binding protein YihA/YsxC [Dissulfuribacterales bacterium]
MIPDKRQNQAAAPFVIRDVQFVLSAVKPDIFPADGLPEIAFAGRSNAGKSSVLRLLLNRRAFVRVSSTPGHTQALNYYRLDYRINQTGFGSCYFVDMPGYGFARAPKTVQESWKHLIEAYLERKDALVMLFCIFDIRREPDAMDMSLLDYLRSVGIPFCILLNKADKLSHSQRLTAKRRFDAMAFVEVAPVVVSAQTGLGMDEVKNMISGVLS